jgi:ABC-type antimicrobial peptide transport system permease subunit
METAKGHQDRANGVFPPEIWGALSAVVSVIIGVLVGFGIDLFGYAIATGPWAPAKLKAAAWILGAAAGLSFFALSVTVAVAARRLAERQTPGDAVALA